MHKPEFIEKLSEEIGYSKRATTKIVKGFLSCLTDVIKNEGNITFMNFGQFNVRRYPAQEINSFIKAHAPEQNRVAFKMGKELKAAINTPLKKRKKAVV